MIEYRTVGGAEAGEDGILSGLVTPFGVETTIGDMKRGGFKEEMSPGAFTKTLQEQDVVLIHNHDTGMPMARMSVPAGTEGALSFTPTPGDGLRCEAMPVDTSYANDVRKLAKRKILGMSFGFEVLKDRWFDNEGRASDSARGTKRIVDEVRLHEATTTAFPAYGTTLGTVSVRDAVNAARGVEGARAAKATYADLETCGECGSTNEYGSFCSACGEPMSQASGPSGDYCTSCGSPIDGERGAHECYDIRADKPYGDVKYADPKNGKYPIDTEKHVRAAWSYINMPKNAKEYPLNGVTLASVKAKIKAAAKDLGIDISEEKSAPGSTEVRDDPDGKEYAAMYQAIHLIASGKTEEAIAALKACLPEDPEELDSPDSGERSEPAQTTPEIEPQVLREMYRNAYGV